MNKSKFKNETAVTTSERRVKNNKTDRTTAVVAAITAGALSGIGCAVGYKLGQKATKEAIVRGIKLLTEQSSV